jgi:hypothetical protein
MRFITKKDGFGTSLILAPPILISLLLILTWTGTIPKNEILPAIPLLIGSVSFWVFFIVTWFFTYYTLDDQTLTVRMTYFKSRTIALADIKRMKKQEFGAWTYGLSKDVLCVELSNGHSLNISPENRDQMISEIQKRMKGKTE